MKRFFAVILTLLFFSEIIAISISYSVEPYSNVKRFVQVTDSSINLYKDEKLNSFPINYDQMIDNGCGPKTASNAILYFTDKNPFSQYELGEYMDTGRLGTMPNYFSKGFRKAFKQIPYFHHDFQFPAYGFWASPVNINSGDFEGASVNSDPFFWTNGGEKTYQYYLIEQLLRGYPVPVLLTRCTYDGGCSVVDFGSLHYVLVRGVSVSGNLFDKNEITIDKVHIIDNFSEDSIDWNVFKEALEFDVVWQSLNFFTYVIVKPHVGGTVELEDFVKPLLLGRVVSDASFVGEEFEKNANGVDESFVSSDNGDYFNHYESDFSRGSFWRKVSNPDSSLDKVEYSFGSQSDDPLTYSSNPETHCDDSDNSFISLGYTGWDFKNSNCNENDTVSCWDTMSSYEDHEQEGYYLVEYKSTLEYEHRNCGIIGIAAKHAAYCHTMVQKDKFEQIMKSKILATCYNCEIKGKHRCRSFESADFVFSTVPDVKNTDQFCNTTDFKAYLSNNTDGLTCRWYVNGSLEKEEDCSGENFIKWPYSKSTWSIGNKIEMQVLFSQTGKVLDSVIWENNANRDGDDFPNTCDLCPSDASEENVDICHDDDGDDVPNAYDNCFLPNRYEDASLNDELISGECRGGVDQGVLCQDDLDGGAIRNINTYKNGYYENTGTGIFSDRVWKWQPDHDLDGIGDACDSILIDGNDGFKAVSRLISYPASSYSGNSSGDSVSGIYFSGIEYVNRFVNIHYKVEDGTVNSEEGSTDSSKVDVSTMYCWVRDRDFDEFGKEGYCTRNNNGAIVSRNRPDFGYSHGSDPKPYRTQGIVTTFSWQKPIKESTEFKDEGYAKIKWDWLENLKTDYSLLYDSYVKNLQGSEDFMKYTVSSGVKTDEFAVVSHFIRNNSGGFKINSDFFQNKKIFARARRDEKNDMKGTFLSYSELGYEGVIPGRIYLDPYPRYPEFIDSCPECWQMPEGLNGLINIWKYDYMEGVLSTTMKGFSPVGETKTFLSSPDGTIAAISQYDDALFISFNRSNLSDMKVAAVTSIPSDGIVPGKAALAGGTLYFAGENTLYTVQRISDEFSSQTSEELPVADLIAVARLPYPAAEMRFFGIENDLYALHDDGRTMSMYVLDDDEFVESADSGNYPSSRMQGAFRVINGELYLAGGGNSYGEDIERFSDVWKYNTETGWALIVDDLEMETLDLFIKSDGENLYLFSRTYPDKEVETAVVNITEGTVEYEKTVVTGDASLNTPKEDICLNREGNSVFPGKLKYNQCSRFEEYQYKKYSFFDYKFSLSGKDRYLFSGGLSGIRTFKIRKNGKLKKTHFKTLGLINSIAVSGSTLFAAGGSRVFVLKIGKNGKLTETGSIKTDECWNIRVENGYLFAGENGKVKIYNIKTDSTPQSVKEVSLFGNVKDLEVKGNSLFVYHESGWWFWKNNDVQKIDITDVYNPVKLNEISFECRDVEFATDRSTVYMGCKNGQREIVEDGDNFSLRKISGKKNYFRDSYFYNGVGYTVHSGSIYLSR